MMTENGWPEYQRLVMSELQRLSAGQVALTEKVTELVVEVARLKLRAGLWGAVAGSVPVALGLAFAFLK